jgi:hypothetical protein
MIPILSIQNKKRSSIFFDVIRPDNDYNEEQMATQKGFLEERDYLPKEKEIMRKILLTGEYEEKTLLEYS